MRIGQSTLGKGPDVEPSDEYAKARISIAAGRSYTNSAVLTLVLYFVLWIPGLIANLVYYNQAKSDMALTGHQPEGMGCLQAMLIVFIALPVGLLVLAMIAFAAAG